MKNFRFFMLLALLSTLSCKSVILKVFGVDLPKLESKFSITKYSNELGLSDNNLYCFKDSIGLHNFFKSGIGMPEAVFFSKDFRFIDYRTTPNQCNGGIHNFMDSLLFANPIISNDSLLFSKLTKDIQPFSDTTVSLTQQTECDFYVLFYWTKYFGKNNKEKIVKWEKVVADLEAKGNKICDIKIIADFLDIYGYTQKEIDEMVNLNLF